ncbi:MAG: hypothetical protein JXJ04_17260, partial [Spirochaetales bacterium]|nr:hypothetical protein [Spirochaetales bacterium]
LDLINYHVPDPVDSFYSSLNFPLGTSGADSRSLLLDPVTYDIKDLPGGGGKGAQEETGLERKEGEGDSGINIRRDFRALAVFKHGLVTDADGTVICDFTLPDTLTTYRMTAIAVKEDLFGNKEEELMVQNPLNVRTALNRRLRVRDTSFAGVVITNLDSMSHEVSVTAQSDIIKIDDEKTKAIAIPPNSSVEVPFSLVAVMAGEASISFTIHSDVLHEKLEEKIIIEKPLIKESFTITGKTSAGTGNKETDRIDEGIIIPAFIAEGFGGLFLTLDSTRLATLSTSVDYLFEYPYGCVEQHLSRLLPLIVFGKNIKAFGLSSIVTNPKDTIEETLAAIARFQSDDGGVPFWMEGGYPSSSYCSVKLAHIAFLAQSGGYSTGSLDINALLRFIKGLTYPKYPRYIYIYSLYVRSLYGENVGSESEQLFKDDTENTLTTYGFLGLTFYQNKNKKRADECLGKMKNYIKIGTRTIDIVEKDSNRYYFDSEVQKLALLLMLYDTLDPESDFIEKITLTLMKRQKYGYWVNTADTGWALTAFAQIFGNEAGEKTDFIAKVLINEEELLKTTFKGISKKSYTTSFLFDEKPLSEFKKDTLLPFSFQKEGPGTLFYTARLTYALPTEVIRARDEGFSVYTEILDSYGKVLDPDELSLGETYTMRAVISSSKQHNYVVVRVPVPSGGEILDASFVTTGSYEEQGGIDKNSYTGENAYGDEYSYENSESYLYFRGYGPRKIIMDNEVRYFFDDFYRGKQEVEFLFRLTTPGIYPTPPAFAECMYEEEIFGRSDGRIYVIRE